MEIDELEKVIQPIFKNLVKLTYSISDVPYVERFYVIPGNDGPRWIVPCDPKYGMPVLAKWRPWDRSSRIKWEFVKAAYKLRCLGHLSGVQQVGVHGSSSINCGSITAIEEGLLIPSIYIGTPGVTSKAVTGLVAKGSGVTHSIVKTPIGYLSGRRIQHEANILASLNTLNQGVAPQLLYYDDVENILVQQVVDGNAPSVKLTSAHNSYIEKLISTHTYTCIKERAEELLPRISRLFGNDEARERVLVNVLCTLNDQQQIPNAWCHGDFTPWNIKQQTNNTLIAFDWEFAEENSVPGLDIVHYLTAVNYHLKRRSPTLDWFDTDVCTKLSDLSCFKDASHHLLSQIWKYYIIWYLVVARENDSWSPYSESLYDVCAELVNN